MQYRIFGNTGKKVSVLGFGAMRLPTSSHRQQDVMEKEAIEIIRRAAEAGVNYFDTAYPYHSGRSEVVMGKALTKKYRNEVYIADKFPSWLLKDRSDFDRIFAEQLKRLKTDRIDFYLMHALNDHHWKKIKETGILGELEKAKNDGRIGHIGFSFHDSLEVFKRIIDEYESWEFCQIQYNYMDVEIQAGTAGLEYAAAKNLGIVIMEPLRGGQLASVPPQPVQDAWNARPDGISLVEKALRFIWDREEVSLLLSGMTTMEQLEDNLVIADRARAGQLSEDDKALYDRVRGVFRELQPIPCTQCKYCMPCPSKVQIPDILKLYNESVMYNSLKESRRVYNYVMQPKNRADNCIECGQCEEACPQNIEIMSWLKKAHEKLLFR